MSVVYKYILELSHNKVQLPKGAKVLIAREQGDNICIWVEVNDDAELETRVFEIYGTGQLFIDYGRKYIGTAFIRSLVLHVYELLEA